MSTFVLMQTPDIYSDVMARLASCPLTIDQLAEGAGVNRHWLAKLRLGKFDDPGVKRMQKLHRYLVEIEKPKRKPRSH